MLYSGNVTKTLKLHLDPLENKCAENMTDALKKMNVEKIKFKFFLVANPAFLGVVLDNLIPIYT